MSTHLLDTTKGWARPRLLGLAGAVLLNEALWLLATLVLGIQVQAPASSADLQPTPIAPLLVAIASLVGYLAGWGLLAVLERLTVRARGIWLGVALVALAASLGMPLSGTGIDAANRVVLVLMHLAVAAVLLPVAYRTSAPRNVGAIRSADRIRATEAA